MLPARVVTCTIITGNYRITRKLTHQTWGILPARVVAGFVVTGNYGEVPV